jgi:hypothetical protein
MKKVYVIGAGSGQDAGKRAREVLELKEEVEIICVESIEDIPFGERAKSDPSSIRQIFEIKAPPILPISYVIGNKKKKHERPYRYYKYKF